MSPVVVMLPIGGDETSSFPLLHSRRDSDANAMKDLHVDHILAGTLGGK